MRLRATSLLIHCLSAAVYPLIALMAYPRMGMFVVTGLSESDTKSRERVFFPNQAIEFSYHASQAYG